MKKKWTALLLAMLLSLSILIPCGPSMAHRLIARWLLNSLPILQNLMKTFQEEARKHLRR